MAAVIWLILTMVSRGIVLNRSGIPSVFSVVPFWGNFCIAQSAGRPDVGVIRMLSGIMIVLNLFFIFAVSGKYDLAATVIDFIDRNILSYGIFWNFEDLFIFLLLILIGMYLITNIIISLGKL